MCRYSNARYKPHYACFNCRKAFKRRLMHDINGDDTQLVEAKCPQCGSLMADMGLDFEAPKKDDTAAWNHMKTLYSVGITFHSCGCGGPGYIPRNTDALILFLKRRLEEYKTQLSFWQGRPEPTNDKYFDKIVQIPYEVRPKQGVISNDDARKFWIGRIKEIEQNLATVTSSQKKAG